MIKIVVRNIQGHRVPSDVVSNVLNSRLCQNTSTSLYPGNSWSVEGDWIKPDNTSLLYHQVQLLREKLPKGSVVTIVFPEKE